MTDDIVTLLNDELLHALREYRHHDAEVLAGSIDEITHLRVALALACGELSTYDMHRHESPEPLMAQFLEEARRG